VVSDGNKELLAEGLRFRIDRREPLVLIDAYVNGKGPFNFVVDTGASMTVISPAVARATHIDQDGARGIATGATGNLHVRAAKLESLKLGSSELKNVDVAIMSLAVLNRASRLGLGGILGYNVLKKFQITINYKLRRILFTPFDKQKSHVGVRTQRQKR